MKIMFLFLGLAASSLFGQEAWDIEGLWYMHPDDLGNVSVARIFEQNGLYYAYAFTYTNEVVRTAKGGEVTTDIYNPNPELRSRPLSGMVFLKNLAFEKGRWGQGSIYRPTDGKTFYVRARLSPDRQNLILRASIDKAGVLGINLHWSRAPSSYEEAAQKVPLFF